VVPSRSSLQAVVPANRPISGADRVLAKHRALARRESWYGHADIASIILFTVGWGLGLIGNRCQIKGLVAEQKYPACSALNEAPHSPW
jgi:hypothetical protein